MVDMEEIYARLGRNLKFLRGRYGMSRNTLAKLVGIPQTRLRRLEAGDSHVRMYDFHLCRLADVLAVSTDVLLKDELSCEEQ